jgi:adenine-specific DNA methylase
MDFFHVWLRRSLFDLTEEFAIAFSEKLGPKWALEDNDGELVDQPSRFKNDAAVSKRVYENGMAKVFSKCHGALASEGRLVLVFANKNPNAWETLVTALIRAGFLVDGSWPIQTERGARTNAITTASLASSVWLVCKKRLPARPGFDTNVLTDMRSRIHTQLRAFWDAGIRGPDFVWAATGPALEAYSKYPVVRKAGVPDGDPNALMTVSEFLREVRRLVVDFVVGRVLSQGDGSEDAISLDDVTTYYLLHRNDFGLDEAPIGACILYALSCNLSDGELADRLDILSRTGGNFLDEADDEVGGEPDEEDGGQREGK